MEAHRRRHAEASLEMIEKAVRHACVAGGLRILSRREPAVTAALVRVANAHEAKCNAILDQVIRPQRSPRRG